MSRTVVSHRSSTTVTVEEPVTSEQLQQLEESSPEQLLVAIDVAERGHRVLLENTVRCLVTKAGSDEALKLEYVRNIILIGFKNLPH